MSNPFEFLDFDKDKDGIPTSSRTWELRRL
jgi:hypothetical protein